MKFSLLPFGLIAIFGLLTMFSVVGFGISTEFYGDIFDSSGRRLYPTAGDNFWLGENGDRFDIDPGESNSIVAFSLDGRELGTGRISGIDYQLNLRNTDERTILLYAGFYDAVRPERNHLLYCTSLDLSTLPVARKVLLNLKCDGITLFEGSTGLYR